MLSQSSISKMFRKQYLNDKLHCAGILCLVLASLNWFFWTLSLEFEEVWRLLDLLSGYYAVSFN